jgi:hypothetical protein
LRDFTLYAYDLLVSSLEERGYRFRIFENFLDEKSSPGVVMRHDVDRRPQRAVLMADYESRRSIRASYHIRVPERRTQDHENMIRKIVSLGHEIAYHYEDYSRTMIRRSLLARKILSDKEADRCIAEAGKYFRHNLDYLRKFYPVTVISMHGSPLSGYDNRDIWKHLDYRSFGIVCEPYFDINPDEILSLTDTGRRWNATGSNRRDHIPGRPRINRNFFDGKYPRSTFQLIQKIKDGLAPRLMVISAHPQRWTNGIFPWLEELMWQNTKNIFKSLLRD